MKEDITNRNYWSKKEEEILIKKIRESVTGIGNGAKAAASILGRSERACLQHYYQMDGKKDNVHFRKITKRNITFTDVEKEANQCDDTLVIVKGSSLIRVNRINNNQILLTF